MLRFLLHFVVTIYMVIRSEQESGRNPRGMEGVVMENSVMLPTVTVNQSYAPKSYHLQCTAGDWVLGSTVTLRCFLPKDVYPEKCTPFFINVLHFYKKNKKPFSAQCEVQEATSCTPSSDTADCGCEPGNSTFYVLKTSFTVTASDNGTWECTIPCLDASYSQILPFTSDSCKNKKVVESNFSRPTDANASTPTATTRATSTSTSSAVATTITANPADINIMPNTEAPSSGSPTLTTMLLMTVTLVVFQILLTFTLTNYSA